MIKLAWAAAKVFRDMVMLCENETLRFLLIDDPLVLFRRREQPMHETLRSRPINRGAAMTRIIEHRQDAYPDEELFELRVFRLHDGEVHACVVPADLAINLDTMADMSEPVAQAFLDGLALCEREGIATLWVHDPFGLFPPRDRPVRETR